MTLALTQSEVARRDALEKIISRGQKTFLAVGSALREILDSKLYRNTHKTFAEYCREEWGWGKSYAYNLINAAHAVKALPEKTSTIVDTESKAREVARVPEAERPAIIERAAAKAESEQRPMTARDIRQAASPVVVDVTASVAVDPPALVEDITPIERLRAELAEADRQIAELQRKKGELQKQLREAILKSPGAVVCAEPYCEEPFGDASDGVTLYECGDCGQTFTEDDSADGGSNRCPYCNKFASKLTDHGCPKCCHGELLAPAEAQELKLKREQDAAL